MPYEILYIIPANKTEEEVVMVKDEVSALLKKHGQEVTRDESIGKRRFAYPIGGLRYGYYVYACFTAEPTSIQALETELRHNHNVLRHMVTKALAGAETLPVKLLEYEVPDIGRKKPMAKKPVAKRVSAEETPEVMSEEQLDKKLDEILDEKL